MLAATLPLASGYDWRFALRPDAKTIADALRQAVPMLERYRELLAGLSTPKGNQTLEDLRLGITQVQRDAELRAALSQPWNETLRNRLANGIELLRSRLDIVGQLSLPYNESIPTKTVAELLSDHRELKDSSWPMSMMRKRSLAKKLKELATGGSEPDIDGDIERLSKIDALNEQIKALDDLSLPTSNAWAGLKTDLDVVRALLDAVELVFHIEGLDALEKRIARPRDLHRELLIRRMREKSRAEDLRQMRVLQNRIAGMKREPAAALLEIAPQRGASLV